MGLRFVRLHENNEHEGESWNFWLQLSGNEAQLAKLDALMNSDCDYDQYSLHMDEVEEESVVNKLVAYADEGYMLAHNKVTGTFTCPDDLGEYAEKLYKGQVTNFFEK